MSFGKIVPIDLEKGIDGSPLLLDRDSISFGSSDDCDCIIGNQPNVRATLTVVDKIGKVGASAAQ